MKREHWCALSGQRKAFYLLAPGLPLAGFLILFSAMGFRFGPLRTNYLWWFILAVPALGLLLGAVNLALIWAGRPPREKRDRWDALLAVSLPGSVVLLGIEATWLLVLLAALAGAGPR